MTRCWVISPARGVSPEASILSAPDLSYLNAPVPGTLDTEPQISSGGLQLGQAGGIRLQVTLDGFGITFRYAE